MLRSLLSIILFAGTIDTVMSQPVQFVLTSRQKGSSPNRVDYILNPRNLTGKDTFKGLPQPVGYEIDYRISWLDFQKGQTVYEKYLHKQILNEQDSTLLQEQDISKLSTKPTKHRLFFLTYFEENKKITIADQNYNHDFSDDQVFEFRIKDNRTDENEPGFADLNIRYEYVEDGQVISRQVPVRIQPFNKFYEYPNFPEGRFHVNAQIYEYVHGTIAINDTVYYFNACSGPNQRGLFNDFEMHFSSVPFSDTIRFGLDQMVKSKDAITMGGKTFTAHFSTFGDTFFLQPYSIKEMVPVNLVEDLSKKTTTNNKKLDTSQIQVNDFTVLDFWGTWCAPCVQDLPELAKLYQQYHAAGVYFIGVAIDNDQKKVEDFRVLHNIHYPIIFENLNLGTGWLYKKMNITVFPTYMLLDKTGNVIYTVNSVEELEKKLKVLTESKK